MLTGCHERVRRSLALLARLADHLRRRGADAAARDAAADVLRYFERAAPAHHDDEERHVLPKLRAAGEPAMALLAARLHADHERMAEAWAQMRPGLEALAGGGPAGGGGGVADEAARSVASRGWFDLESELPRWQAFAALYEGHLEAEEAVAFPAAARCTHAAARAAMGAEMARRRGVIPMADGPGERPRPPRGPLPMA